MDISCWVHYWGQAFRQEEKAFMERLVKHGLKPEPLNQNMPRGAGVCFFSEATPEFRNFLHTVSCAGRERIIVIAGSVGLLKGDVGWNLLKAGASDILVWSDPDRIAQQCSCALAHPPA